MEITPTVTMTRFDRNVAENILDFSMYKEDEILVKKLVFFFAHDFQHKICSENIFGYKILNPVDFAKVVGYKNYRSLINTHPNPAQFHNKTPEQIAELKQRAESGEEPLWDSFLDNALYRVRYEALRFSKGGKTYDGFSSSELKEIKFLKHLKKFHHSGRKKTYYEFAYDDTFVNDLARVFIRFDFSIYTALPKPSHQDFYISMINMRDRFNIENAPAIRLTAQFDNLCKLAKTNCSLPEDRKKAINQAVKELNKYHGSEFLKIKWERNGKHNYKPVLDFRLTDKELAETKKEQYARLDHYVMHNLKTKFRENFPLIKEEQEFKMSFIKLLKNVDHLFEVKHSVFLQTHIQCFGREVRDPWGSQTLEYIKEKLPLMADGAFPV